MTMLRLRSGDVSWRTIDGEVIAVDVASSMYLSANRSGALLWEMLGAGTTRSDLVARLVEEFGITVETAETDVDAFVAAVSAHGLLET